MKIYTRGGDDGSTGLFGGRRVSKADARIQCCGALDELNAMIGWAAVAALEGEGAVATNAILPRLRVLQHELFNLGAIIATPADQRPKAKLPTLPRDAAARLEREIDEMDTELPPLKNFILPGGSETAARLHLARTTCRSAERVLVQFSNEVEPLDPPHLQFINRLSDWLFTAARLANKRAGVDDVPWTK